MFISMSPDSTYYLPMKSTTRPENDIDAKQKLNTPATPFQQFNTSSIDCSRLQASNQVKLQSIISRIQHFEKEHKSLIAHIEAEREDLVQRREFESKKANREIVSRFNELNSILNTNLTSVEARQKHLESLIVDIDMKKW